MDNLFPKSWLEYAHIDRVMNWIGYILLIGYSFVAMFPIFLIVINSVKEPKQIFRDPYSFPSPIDFDGYDTVIARSNFPQYFANSITIVVVVMVAVLLFGAMVSFALSEYRFRGNGFLNIYFALGIMIPIRLGTVSIVNIMKGLDLQGTIVSLILVYTAMGLPLTIFVLSSFMRDIPRDLKDAARVDGASEYRIFFTLVLPLLRPALATVAVFHMIPVWNDLWWPLVLAPGEATRTVTLGVSAFVGQFLTNYSALLSALSLGMVPVLILYALFSRQLIRGLSAGAVKA